MRVLVALVLLIAVLFCSVSAQGEHLKNSNTFTWTGEVLADEIADLVATAVAEILSDSENSVMCVSVSDALNVRNENGAVVSTLAPNARVTAQGTKQMRGESFTKIGNNQYVASRFLKACGSSTPSTPAPVGSGFDCGMAYSNGRATSRQSCVTIDGKPVTTTTAAAYNKMKAAAAAAGIQLRINSGFRTQSEQEYFYNCYVTKRCNNGNLAARPGYSNHQNGLALDINVTSSSTYNWLVNNASKYGFVRTVPSEKWHWELRNSRCNAFVSYSCQ